GGHRWRRLGDRVGAGSESDDAGDAGDDEDEPNGHGEPASRHGQPVVRRVRTTNIAPTAATSVAATAPIADGFGPESCESELPSPVWMTAGAVCRSLTWTAAHPSVPSACEPMRYMKLAVPSANCTSCGVASGAPPASGVTATL